eukprot:TRINITY_DN3296_c0_g2_i1.p1 TRINITY_DN3296_c0_g2~~TRINITY_DN3296_c0_g2_i1.p1  ORF type:complete len:850 (-),score=437.26 TRINITY_DN3296_c0_g2_i1:39-2588(-)
MDNYVRNLFHQDIYAYLNKNNFKTAALLFEKDSGLQFPPNKTGDDVTNENFENLFNYWKISGLETRKSEDEKYRRELEEEEKRKKEEEELKNNEEKEKKMKAKAWRMKILQREKESQMHKEASEEQLWKFREKKQQREVREEYNKLMEEQELVEIEEEGFEIEVGDLISELGLDNTDVEVEYEEMLGGELDLEGLEIMTPRGGREEDQKPEEFEQEEQDVEEEGDEEDILNKFMMLLEDEKIRRQKEKDLEKQEEERIKKEREEQEMKEKEEKEQKIREENERIQREKEEREKKMREEEELRLQKEKEEREREELEKREKEEQEERERLEREKKEREEREKEEQEEKERLEKLRIEMERKIQEEKDNLERERLQKLKEQEELELHRQKEEKERLRKEKEEQERVKKQEEEEKLKKEKEEKELERLRRNTERLIKRKEEEEKIKKEEEQRLRKLQEEKEILDREIKEREEKERIEKQEKLKKEKEEEENFKIFEQQKIDSLKESIKKRRKVSILNNFIEVRMSKEVVLQKEEDNIPSSTDPIIPLTNDKLGYTQSQFTLKSIKEMFEKESDKPRARTATRTVIPKTNAQVSSKLPNCTNCKIELKIDSPTTYLCEKCGKKFARKVQATASEKIQKGITSIPTKIPSISVTSGSPSTNKTSSVKKGLSTVKTHENFRKGSVDTIIKQISTENKEEGNKMKDLKGSKELNENKEEGTQQLKDLKNSKELGDNKDLSGSSDSIGRKRSDVTTNPNIKSFLENRKLSNNPQKSLSVQDTWNLNKQQNTPSSSPSVENKSNSPISDFKLPLQQLQQPQKKMTTLKCPKCTSFLEEISESVVFCGSCKKKFAKKKK